MAGVAFGCATGLDVSDQELSEICAEPSINCQGIGGLGGTSSSAGVVNILGGAGPAGGVAGQNASAGSGAAGDADSFGGVFDPGGGEPPVNGGSGGSEAPGGSGAPLPLAAGECMASDQVVILYTNRASGETTGNQASMDLSVRNDGAPFELTALTIRYWFTADGLSGFTGNVDYASQSGGQQLNGVTVNFGQERGSDYAEIGFDSGGSVGSEGVQSVQVRIHTGDFQQLNHANDFSFVAVADAAANRNLTPYVNGVQVGGCVPIP